MNNLATSKTKQHSKRLKSAKPAEPALAIPPNQRAKPAIEAAKLGRGDKQLVRDRELVRRCVGGDVAGWEQMYKECHPKLLLNIRALIRPYGHNANLADEIASRVWCSLIGANGTLLDRYDSHRGCKLSTFFAALARYELLKYWRSEKRRREREQAVVRRRVRHRFEKSESFHIAWGEFVDTLTRRERDFLEQVLIAPDNDGEATVALGEDSMANGGDSVANGAPSSTNGKHSAALIKHAADGKHRAANGKQNGAASGKETVIKSSNDDGDSHAADPELPSDTSTGGLSQANSWQLRSRVLSKLKRFSGDGQT